MERLTKELDRLTEQVAMCEAQGSAQAEETQAAREALSEVTVNVRRWTFTRRHVRLIHQTCEL